MEEAPVLMPENSEAIRLWRHVMTQWRSGPAGVIGLDYPAARREAGHLGIAVTYGMMRKLQVLEQLVLEHCHDRTANDD